MFIASPQSAWACVTLQAWQVSAFWSQLKISFGNTYSVVDVPWLLLSPPSPMFIHIPSNVFVQFLIVIPFSITWHHYLLSFTSCKAHWTHFCWGKLLLFGLTQLSREYNLYFRLWWNFKFFSTYRLMFCVCVRERECFVVILSCGGYSEKIWVKSNCWII